MYKFSTVDISELARTSVLLSDIPETTKAFLGEKWAEPGVKGNGTEESYIVFTLQIPTRPTSPPAGWRCGILGCNSTWICLDV
jgi:hypothetical protein